MVAFRLRAQNAPPVLVPAVSRGAGRSGTAFRLRATTDRHQSQCANGGIECYPRLLGPLPGLSCRFTSRWCIPSEVGLWRTLAENAGSSRRYRVDPVGVIVMIIGIAPKSNGSFD